MDEVRIKLTEGDTNGHVSRWG